MSDKAENATKVLRARTKNPMFLGEGVQANRIILAGDSAGANLATVAALALRREVTIALRKYIADGRPGSAPATPAASWPTA